MGLQLFWQTCISYSVAYFLVVFVEYKHGDDKEEEDDDYHVFQVVRDCSLQSEVCGVVAVHSWSDLQRWRS